MTKERQTAPDNDHEPLAMLLRILASPWTVLLLHRLHVEGPRRFGELKRRLGSISTKTLTERLRSLEREGCVSRHYEPTVPPQVTYTLTERALELDGVMRELDRIAERWYGNAGEGSSAGRRSDVAGATGGVRVQARKEPDQAAKR
jgi:DNA-binding HxlR family transcriptional regulator